jgi:hypothetical protein
VSAPDRARLERVLALVRGYVPKLALINKQTVPWMRAAGTLARPFAPDFATSFTTVLGAKVYLPCDPADFNPDTLAMILAHELVHQLDQGRWGPLFYLSYGVALPAGRTLRAHWERRAYAVDLLLAKERGGEAAVELTARRLAALFSGPAYVWMWAGRSAAREFLKPVVQQVLDGSLEREAPYREILTAWRG